MANGNISLNSEDVFREFNIIQVGCERIAKATKTVCDLVKAEYERNGLKWFATLNKQTDNLVGMNTETLENLDEIMATLKKYDEDVSEYSTDDAGLKDL